MKGWTLYLGSYAFALSGRRRETDGNTQGVAALVKGMKVEEAIARLKGIQCGFRGTSCPDQLACALEEHLAK